MQIVYIPRRKEHAVHSVMSNRRVAMTVETLNGLGATDPATNTQVIETVVKAEIDWKMILAVAIPLAILIPILLAGLSGEKPSESK